MAYITLEELEKILQGILNQWIDKDDESWEWIFQEIEQKCHVGKNKKDKKPKKKDMQNAMEIAIMAHRNDINELTKKYDEIKFNELKKIKEDIAFLITRIHVISGEVKEAKFAAQTAKQRTEVDYSKYSSKSDGEKMCKTCKYYVGDPNHLLLSKFDAPPCDSCNHNNKWEAKENE